MPGDGVETAADGERRLLLPTSTAAGAPSSSPLCPYATDVELPPPRRQRRKKPAKGPTAVTDSPLRLRTKQPQPPPPAIQRSQSNQELSTSTTADKKPSGAQQEENQLLTIQKAVFVRSHWAKEAGFWALNVLSLGLLALLCHWYPEVLVRLRFLEVDAADPRAEAVLVAALNGAQTLETVLALDLSDLTKGWQPVRQLSAALRAGGRTAAEATAAVAASPRVFIWRHERYWFRPPRGGPGLSAAAPCPWVRREFDAKRAFGDIHRLSVGRVEETLDDEVALDRSFARALTYGENQLDISAPPFPALVLTEIMKPFFAFQAFSFVVWVLQAYYTYLYVVVTLSVVTILQAAYAEYQNLKALERLARADGVINRIRLIPAAATAAATAAVVPGAGAGAAGVGMGGSSMGMGTGGGTGASLSEPRPAAALAAVPVCCSSLQPGDVVHISTNMVLPCDVLLLTGSCVISEAMLTGESAPVLKAALPLDNATATLQPESDRDSKYVLFSGTKVLQAKGGAAPPVAVAAATADGTAAVADGGRGACARCLWEFPVSGKGGGGAAAASGAITFSETPALGLVLKTGFSTARGQLIRGILYPAESRVNFEKQTLLFLRLLLVVLACGIAFQTAIYRHNGVSGLKTFLDALNLVTVAVPPALPLALSVGVSVALARLKSFGIFCSDSSRIAAAGRVNCLCFDKTGTLTTDGLTLKGVAYVQQQQQQQQQPQPPPSPPTTSPIVSLRAGARPPKPPAAPTTSSSARATTLGGELITDVAQLHVQALTEGVRSKAAAHTVQRTTATSTTTATTTTESAEAPSSREVLQPASNHRLLLSYVLAGCHSISTLEETDEATALVLRCNSEIIADPSFPSELRRLLQERGWVEELLLDPEHNAEPILVKVEVDEAGSGEDGRAGEVGLDRSLSGSGVGHHHHLHHHLHHHHGGGEDEEDEDDNEVVLDLPTLVQVEGGVETKQHLVGDSLEILCFQESGWRYCVRPTGPPNLSDLLKSLGDGAVSKLFRDGRFDGFNIWRHPRLAPYVETVLLPPASIAENRHASALAMVRRFDFDSDLRRMATCVRTLPNLEAGSAAAAAAPPGSKRRLVYDETGQHFLLVKGAPESMRDICRPETLPADLEAQLQRLTLAGYRVLACGARSLEHLSEGEMLTGAREALEADLTFVGLLVMENSLKEETERYLRAYHRAGFRQLMVTGDNPLTALAVSKMAGDAFLCRWRRPLLVDLVPSPANLLELRLCASDVLDPSLRWDLLDYLGGQLGDGVLLLPEGAQQQQQQQQQHGNGGAPSSSLGGSRSRGASVSVSVSASGPPVPPPPPLAGVDFVCTGRAFAHLLGQLHAPLREEADPDGEQWTPLEVVLLRCNVFARMSPQNKQDLMRALQALDYVVAMTGDGANDSGALKAADIGISIASAKNVLVEREEDDGAGAGGGGGGEGAGKDNGKGGVGTDEDDDPENAKIATEISASEAAVTAAPSIAAPFATSIHHIGACETVITEGRGALANSFSVFKYMFLYGIIQFCGVLILYAYLLELSPMQYLYADLFVVLPLVSALPAMEAMPRLTRGKPEGNLVSAPVLCSIAGHAVIIILFQVLQQWMLLQQPWYKPPDYSAPDFDGQITVASSSKFIFSNYAYILLALALCQTYGRFREPIYRNILLSALVAVEVAATIFLTLVDMPLFDRWFQLRGAELSRSYRRTLMALGLANGLAFILYERYLIPHKSLDEDPVVAAPPGAIMMGPPGKEEEDEEEGGEDDATDVTGVGQKRAGWLWRCLNSQPRCLLPKFGHKTPLYQKGGLAFA